MSMNKVAEFAPRLLRLHWDMATALVRIATTAVLALIVFAIVLLVIGKNPAKAYVDIFSYALGSYYGFSEVLVQMTPLLFTAVAAALPFKLGLINIGAEGQLYIGAWLATWAALTFTSLPQAVLLPLMILMGFLGGGLWAAIAGVLRAKGWVNETISTLLLNYVAPLVVNFYIFGPWRSPEAASYPQSDAFVSAARLPTFGNTRVHLGLILALLIVVLFGFFVSRTRWGLEMRAIGGNPEAARRAGINLFRYITVVFFIAGGIAGLAGMATVSAIYGRLPQNLSPAYGFIGFLVSWLAGGNALGIVVMSFLFAIITSGGLILQLTQRVPYAAVLILMALVLFIVLAQPARKGGVR
jgi:simple sugar transport system permease protein